MAASVEDLVRLAWEADAERRPALGDALLTLAVAEAGPGGSPLAARCRRLLARRRPGHWFAGGPEVGPVPARPDVASALAKLRAMFPAVRVERLLLRGAVLRGPYDGQSPPLAGILDDLDTARKPAAATRRPKPPLDGRPLRFPAARTGPANPADPEGQLLALYVSVLLALAVLLDGVVAGPSARDQRAA